MPILLNNEHPYLRIMDPDDGTYYEFKGGKLEIAEGDKGFDVVMAEAQRNPYIRVYESVTSCPHCGEDQPSKKALDVHVHDIHFDKWLEKRDEAYIETRNVEILSREGFPCDVCRPTQTFGTEGDLALHVKAFHTAPPAMDAEGNEKAGGKAGASEPSTEVPAAKPSSPKPKK
jgi:hypothetical protein